MKSKRYHYKQGGFFFKGKKFVLPRHPVSTWMNIYQNPVIIEEK